MEPVKCFIPSCLFRCLTTSPTNSAALSDRSTVGEVAASQKILSNPFATVSDDLSGIGISQAHLLKQHTQVSAHFFSQVMVSNCMTLKGQENISVLVKAETPGVPRSA